MIRRDEVYRIGRIGKPHGVKGEMTFQFDDDVFDRVESDYLFIEIDGILVPFFISEYRFRSNETALVTFEDIDSEEQAKELTGCDVYFPNQELDGHENEISWAELIGYRIVDANSNDVVGTIDCIDDTTINTLFELSQTDGTELLVPASPEIITNIDVEQRIITMNIPEGLLNL